LAPTDLEEAQLTLVGWINVGAFMGQDDLLTQRIDPQGGDGDGAVQ
jgi:hypothetical protein